MTNKVDNFKKRNRRRNAHLYQAGLTEGYDYVVCPISNERLSMIKENYITNILGMQVDQYPDVKRICDKRKENISTGLKEIDSVTGLTKYEVGQVKARKILNECDKTGKSGYKRKGEKTRATHMSNIDEFGRNGYSVLATNAIIKGNRTKADKGLISINRNEFKRYKTIILYLTEKHRKTLTDGYITGLAGKIGAWHIDHKFSILEGYKQKISPFVIGSLFNLEMIPWEKNLKKKSKCSLLLSDLLIACEITKENSEIEFNQIINLIQYDIMNEIPPNGGYIIERFYESNICIK